MNWFFIGLAYLAIGIVLAGVAALILSVIGVLVISAFAVF